MKQKTTIVAKGRGFFNFLCALVIACVCLTATRGYSQTSVSRTTHVMAATSPFQDSLWTIDTNSYTIVRRMGPTVAGHTITGIVGMATDPTTGTHYALLKESAVANRVLATIDLTTGVCTQVGNLGDKFSTIAFNANGTLFGVTGNGATVPETMYKINKGTATKTLFRALGSGADGEIITYCYDNNYFYHWSGNGTVVWERFDTTGTDVIQGLTYTGTPGGETFGGIYVGNGRFLMGNIASNIKVWDTLGNIGPSLMNAPDDLRGYVFNNATSTISTPSNIICSGSSTTLSVAGGTGNYQWYLNGSPIAGATNATYAATTGGVYNSVYTDGNGITDSTATGITMTLVTTPSMTTPANQSVCNGAMTMATSFSAVPVGTTFSWNNSDPSIGLGASGVGDIPSFAAINPTTSPVTAMIMVTPNNGGCIGTMTMFNYVVNPTPSIVTGTMPEVCAGDVSANVPFTGATNVVTKSTTLSYTGGIQTWTVPAGVTSITVDASGAAGGLNSDEVSVVDRPGYGGRVQATLAVTAGQVLNIFVGGKGGDGTVTVGGAAGYNGGATGGTAFATYGGGGGGGATDIRIGGLTLADRVLVAGGGGGAGLDCFSSVDKERGGDGGGTTAEDGIGICNGGNGGGGSPSTGGFGGGCSCIGSAGMAGVFGIGGDAGVSTAGGGGAGGYYGGGGAQWDGGGGGSSYTDAILATAVTHTRGFNTGAGTVTISWAIPTTYDIVWDPAAGTAGFTNVTGASVTGSPITVTVPGAAPAAVYTGSLTLTNSATGCSTMANPISVTVKPIPDVTPVSNQTICNSASSTTINFTGSLVGTTYSWTNSDPTIGVAASGTGDIPSFIATNTSFVPVVAVFTVTPTLNGCTGTAQTFSITVNPTPDVNPSANQSVCNGDMTTAINFTGSVAGTTFSWNNTDPSIGLGASGTGNIAAFTATNSTASPVSGIITVNTTANGCTGTSNSFTITVKPTPMLSSSLNPPAICDNTLFSYTPTSATSGTTFDWSRAAITDIANPAATGTDDPMEILDNTSASTVSVLYVYTLTASGCVNTQTVVASVYPTPMLSTTTTPASVCSGTQFEYGPASATSGTAFSWHRDSVIGISNPVADGVDTIRETLINTTPNPITVTYMDTLMANGCMNIQAITVTVNPKPVLTTPLTIPAICDGGSVFYVSASATTGTTFTWGRARFLTNAPASGADTISETLFDTSANPLPIQYTDTLRANGCMNVQTITLTVNPTPMLSSALAPPGICDSTVFNYTPLSRTVGSSFAWTRPYVLGIAPAATTGFGNPNEVLKNNTNDNLNVTYVYTVTANGCTHSQNVVVVVHPTPTLASSLTPKACSGQDVNYTPIGYVFGTSFAWKRLGTAGIKPATGNGIDAIHEVLTDTALVPLTAVYVYTLTANGCSHVQNVMLTLNPAPPVLPITTHSPSSLCNNTLFQNFGTSSMPPANQQYHWTATNATVYATGQGGQYALINFDRAGDAVVTLKSNVTGIACVTNSSFNVTVGTAVSEMPRVVYFEGQFICMPADEDSYQWGYDDGITLDSTLLEGEQNPNYFISGPDTDHRHYWVITKKGDCMQKTYYNRPLGIMNINSDEMSLKVYPNPASNLVNVEINTSLNGNYDLEVMNMLGQKVLTTTTAERKATFDVANLPAGAYIVDCYRSGVKVGAVRFIKN